jgi:hypothetical protein
MSGTGVAGLARGVGVEAAPRKAVLASAVVGLRDRGGECGGAMRSVRAARLGLETTTTPAASGAN